ncbi:MAG: DinB family protein [Caldilineaceae bacterium]|nr:DinB family protein [Caldilineaceae bacterium]
MYMKTHMLAALREEFDHWESVLASLSEAQITAQPDPNELSLKDELAHLWAWQQRSIARMEAGVNNTEPQMPQWWPDATVIRADAEADHEAINDQINAQIYELYREHPWSQVYAAWRTAFLHFLTVSQQVSEPALLDAGRYTWLSGYSLADVLLGSYDHHQEHLDKLLARLNQE